MGLEDAIQNARRKADLLESQARQTAARGTRERQEADELLAEAVQRLQRVSDEFFFQVKRSPIGKYRGPGGHRYKTASRQRCWLLSEMEGQHPETEIYYTSPLLLLENATAVRAWLDVQGGPGEYVSSVAPTPLGQDYFPMLAADTPGGWLGQLKRYLGEAVVRYERDR